MQMRFYAEVKNLIGETLESIQEKNGISSVKLPAIESAAHFEHKGDVIIQGNIGKNATVTVHNGTLVVEGNIEENATIHLDHDPIHLGAMSFHGDLTIEGVKISANKLAHVKGHISNHVTFHTRGDISIDGNTGSNCSFVSQNGKVTISGNKGENNLLQDNSNNPSKIMAKNGFGPGLNPATRPSATPHNNSNENKKSEECRLF